VDLKEEACAVWTGTSWLRIGKVAELVNVVMNLQVS
jgi:hypothetical protein